MSYPLFISHSHVDSDLAEAMVDLFRAALNLADSEIRCSSVDGTRLPGGTSIDERLRSEIRNAKTFFALMTPASITSLYVLFEIGARWGTGLPLVPITARAAKGELFKGPLSGINFVDATSRAGLYQLVAETAQSLGRPATGAASYMRFAERLETLARVRL
jgi:hypothetical protein